MLDTTTSDKMGDESPDVVQNEKKEEEKKEKSKGGKVKKV